MLGCVRAFNGNDTGIFVIPILVCKLGRDPIHQRVSIRQCDFILDLMEKRLPAKATRAVCMHSATCPLGERKLYLNIDLKQE
jgi:hypothetical protein